MNQVFDKLKEYIDIKILELDDSLKDLFDSYNLEELVPYLPQILTVSDNITDVITVANGIYSVANCSRNMNYIKFAPQAASQAEYAADRALASASDALVFRDNAYNWSQAPENLPVDDGEHQGYSSYHWARKAQEVVEADTYYLRDGSQPITGDFAGGGFKITNIADGVQTTDGASLGQVSNMVDNIDKGDIGLGNVPDLDTTDAVNHVGTTDNPHSVTKAQVGLDFVINTGSGTIFLADDGTYKAAAGDMLKSVYDTNDSGIVDNSEQLGGNDPGYYAAATDLSGHIGNVSNPHTVTKAQVGLGSADDTSDLDKPISTATQAALDGKSDSGHTHDDIYYQETEFIDQTTGTPDAGKPIVLNTSGMIDASMVPIDSGWTNQGQFTPADGAEYPDTTGLPSGSFWSVIGVDATNGYTFVGGDLAGQVVNNGNLMVWAGGSWSIKVSELNPFEYYKLDGTHAITAPFAGGGQQFKNAIDGTDNSDLTTLSQLNTGLGTKADVSHDHVVADITDFDAEVSGNADVSANTSARHTHANSTVLDIITDAGAGDVFLADDGTYKGVPGGISSFTGLSDTPADYTGSAGMAVFVNAGEDALEFASIGGGGDMLKSVYDTDDSGIVDNAELLTGLAPAALPISTATQTALDAKEDDLGLGTAGQVLTTNAAADGTEWTTISTGSGDMLKSVYDTDDSGIVDDAEMLGTQPPSYYAVASDLTAHTGNTANPHTVTKDQVGLGFVVNTGTGNKYLADNGNYYEMIVDWGTITGDITAQTDLQDALALKADHNGVTLSSGGDGTQYLANDGAYKTVVPNIQWGQITGSLANQIDLQEELDSRPYSDPALVPETSSAVANMVTMTQADYDLLTPDPATLYIIVG
jgi:hypothetical protein